MASKNQRPGGEVSIFDPGDYQEWLDSVLALENTEKVKSTVVDVVEGASVLTPIGLSIDGIKAGETYAFELVLFVVSANANTGIQLQAQGINGLTASAFQAMYIFLNSTATFGFTLPGSLNNIMAAGTSFVSAHTNRVYGRIVAATDGDLRFDVKSETNGVNVTVFKGSLLRYKKT